jgi:hypothetical protein
MNNKKNADETKVIKAFLYHELKELLHIDLNPDDLEKYIFLLSTGVRATDKKGNVHYPPPIGPALTWSIAALLGKESPFVKIHFTAERLDPLLVVAKDNLTAWNAAEELAIKIREQKEALPTKLENLIFDSIKGKKPKRSVGRKCMEKQYRNLCIIMLLSSLKKMENTTTIMRSSEYGGNHSFCDFISAIIKTICKKEEHISYEGVKNIWRKRKTLKKSIPGFFLHVTCYHNDSPSIIHAGYCAMPTWLPAIDKIEAQPQWIIKRALLDKNFSQPLNFKYAH